jgi:transcriptional regulator with XRE-family HTH domain
MNIRVERLERGLSQEDIADEAGVSQATWSRAERGLEISPSERKKIADFFERTVGEVWDLDSEVVA